ncbi:glycosyltransferase family 4 protein [Spiractinospora alimapuensis]|uniref:glycosyltransferase family 4 protein n=1 Tax=Spiractinospora alimapuensis TaxID=2820884 RepID=UPI002ED556B9
MILTVARLAPQKGLDTLLDASRRWARRTSVPRVAVAGEGPLRAELQERVDAERLPVRLVGHRDDIADLMAAADVFVLPSLWEGPSLVMMEAMRAALPAVATRVGGIPERYANASLLVPPRDAGALATRGGPGPGRRSDFANRLRAAAAMKAVTLPTESDAVAQLEALYAELATDRGFPPRQSTV